MILNSKNRPVSSINFSSASNHTQNYCSHWRSIHCFWQKNAKSFYESYNNLQPANTIKKDSIWTWQRLKLFLEGNNCSKGHKVYTKNFSRSEVSLLSKKDPEGSRKAETWIMLQFKANRSKTSLEEKQANYITWDLFQRWPGPWKVMASCRNYTAKSVCKLSGKLGLLLAKALLWDPNDLWVHLVEELWVEWTKLEPKKFSSSIHHWNLEYAVFASLLWTPNHAKFWMLVLLQNSHQFPAEKLNHLGLNGANSFVQYLQIRLCHL